MELTTFIKNDFDDLIVFFSPERFIGENYKRLIAASFTKCDDSYQLQLAVPGMKREELRAEIGDGGLIVKGSKEYDSYTFEQKDSAVSELVKKGAYTETISAKELATLYF